MMAGSKQRNMKRPCFDIRNNGRPLSVTVSV
jgi:hypothetical protein